MKRSANMELTQRINEAFMLKKELHSATQVSTVLMQRYDISKRQAYRYIQQAQKVRDILPIPEPKEVFTVKLPKSLICHVREIAKSTGKSLSLIVTQAMEAFLKGEGHGQR